MFGKRKKKRDEIKKNLREKLDYKMKSENVAIPEIHTDRKSTRLNSSHMPKSRMPSSA